MRDAAKSAGLIGLIVCAACFAGAERDDPPQFRATEHQMNTFTYSGQEAPAIAVAADGRGLVVWGSRRQEQGSYGIYGRVIDEAGNPIGGELHINSYMPNNQERPAVAFDERGQAWVVWQSFGADGDAGAISLRRFAEVDGRFVALGEERIVNTETTGDQLYASVVCSGDRALVTWTSAAEAGDRVCARTFDLDGVPIGEAITVAQGDEHHWLGSAAARTNGDFVVVWAARSKSGVPAGLYGRMIDRSGNVGGESFVVASPAEYYDVEPSIDSDERGRFVVTWMRSRDEGGYDVMARMFDETGTPRGDARTVFSGDDGWRNGAAVAMHPDGRFIVAANLEGDVPDLAPPHESEAPVEITARMFDPEWKPLGDPFRANVNNTGAQQLTISSTARRLVWTADDRILTAWQGRIGDDGSGIGVTTRRRDGLARGNDGLLIDDAILSRGVDRFEQAAPPEFDPFHVPDPPDFPFSPPGGDFGFIGFQSTGWTPPDPDIAVGPDHVVVVVNGGIRAYTKDGTLVFDDDISGTDGFWGEVGATHFVFDPVAVYDQLSNRYIVATTEHGDPNRSIEIINLAVSRTSDPLDGWNKYRFNMEDIGNFIDFPNLGVGPDAIYVTTDFFSTPRGNWITIFDKAAAMNGDPITPVRIRTSTGIRSLGAVTSYDADQPAQYFATAFAGSTIVQIDAVRDPLGSPSRVTFNLSVPAFANPPRAEQQGSSNRVATVDRRIKHGVLRNGTLWLAHTIGEDATARVRWYEVAMNGWPESGDTPTLTQTGTQNLGAGVHNWFPDIHPDDLGRVAVAFNQSSAQEFVSVRRTFRLPSDPEGTLREPVLQQESTSPEPGSRWGDYSGVEQDPSEPGSFWNHHEYRTTSWRTWVGKFDIVDGGPLLSFFYPEGLPDQIDSNGGSSFPVEVRPGSESPADGTGILWVKIDGEFEAYPMQDNGGGDYVAGFPPTPCGSTVEFYVSAETEGGAQVNDPPNAPASVFTAESFSEVNILFSDDFETNQGWTVVNEDLTDGAWSRGVPAGDGSRGDPTADFDGSGQCWLTDNVAGNSDVDGGPTRLISPIIDLSEALDPVVSYAAWFFNDDNDEDRLDVEISNNGGSTWVAIESIGNTNGWSLRTFNVADFVAPNDQIRIRFSATDNPNNSITEAAIDAVEVTDVNCQELAQLTDVTIIEGTLISGGLAELQTSDDLYLVVEARVTGEVAEPHLLVMDVGALSQQQNPNSMSISIESKASDLEIFNTLYLRDWNTNDFVEVDNFTTGLTESINATVVLNAGRFVRGGDGRVELELKQVNMMPFTLGGYRGSFDHISVGVQ